MTRTQKLRADLAAVTKERDEARDDLDRTRLAVEEAPHRHHIGMFVAWKDGEQYAVEPDRLDGLWRAIRDDVRKIGDWSAYKAWEKCECKTLRAERDEAQEQLKAFKEMIAFFCGECKQCPVGESGVDYIKMVKGRRDRLEKALAERDEARTAIQTYCRCCQLEKSGQCTACNFKRWRVEA